MTRTWLEFKSREDWQPLRSRSGGEIDETTVHLRGLQQRAHGAGTAALATAMAAVSTRRVSTPVRWPR